MVEAFDPYYQWLAIPPDERPVDHYRLLGLRRFENNGDVISNAADRQMAHVRSFQSGQQSAASQKLLNELAAARVCLLSPERKEPYDAVLRAQSPPKPPADAVRAAESRPAVPATASLMPVRPTPVKPLAVGRPVERASPPTNAPAALGEAAGETKPWAVEPARRVRRSTQAAHGFSPLTIAGGAAALLCVAVLSWFALQRRSPAPSESTGDVEVKTSADDNRATAAASPDANAKSDPPPESKSGLEILSARWGVDDQWLDMTEQLKPLVRGNSLVCRAQFWFNFGDPRPGKGKLVELSYRLGGKLQHASFSDNQLVTIGNGPPRPRDKPQGLAITEALIGNSTVWADVTAATQSVVHDGRLDSWPTLPPNVPIPGRAILFIRYYLGDKEEHALFDPGTPILLGAPAG